MGICILISKSALSTMLIVIELSYGGSGIVTYRYISRMHLQLNRTEISLNEDEGSEETF